MKTIFPYYTIDPANVVSSSGVMGLSSLAYPNNNGILNNNPLCTGSVCTSQNSQYVYKLNGNANKIGLGMVLKVMAGDRIDIFGKSYHLQTTASQPVSSPSFLDIILSSFISANTMIAGKVGVSSINQPSQVLPLQDMLKNQQSTVPTLLPLAYINYVFFDAQLKVVAAGSSPVGASGSIKEHYQDLQNKIAPKNGYVYIYCSNQSPTNVYFDNLQVVHQRSPLLEETHYYPFGLTMAGISDKSAGTLENKRKFNKGSELQNKEFSDGSGLELYATQFRMYDPQIGRWQIIDPKPDVSVSLYSAMDNNPIVHNDPLGDTIELPKASFYFKKVVTSTVANLINRGAGKNLATLLTSKVNVKIVELKGNQSSKYRVSEKTIYWNPKQGLLTTNGTRLSPASVLNHEVDHAEHRIANPNEKVDLDDEYNNEEEKRVVKGSEQTTALALGEIKPGQVTRTDQSALGTFRTNDPMSTSGKVTYLKGTVLPEVIIRSSPKKDANEKLPPKKIEYEN